ncbi:MAG: SDR family NAD(P)-dependent oxidoreductase [Phycicoccus sp.]
MSTHDRTDHGVILVTGASSGIGRATAHELASRGHPLVLVARSATTLEEVALECAVLGGRAITHVADVADRDDVERAAAAALAEFGRLDAVVHAAAVISYGRFEDLPPEHFDAVVRTNLIGTGNVARTALRHFRAHGGGRLVVVGSLLGEISAPFMSSYVTSKWGVHGLVRTIQAEVRHEPGVDVTLVAPGAVDTPIYRQAGTVLGRHGSPPPPVVRPETVARRIVKALDRPKQQVDVGPANRLLVAAFRLLPVVHDAVAAPAMRRLGLSRDDGVPPTPGNVFEPAPEGNAVRPRADAGQGTGRVARGVRA